MTVVLSYFKQQAASAFMRFKRITKESGSIYKSRRERVDSRINGHGGSIWWAPEINQSINQSSLKSQHSLQWLSIIKAILGRSQVLSLLIIKYLDKQIEILTYHLFLSRSLLLKFHSNICVLTKEGWHNGTLLLFWNIHIYHSLFSLHCKATLIRKCRENVTLERASWKSAAHKWLLRAHKQGCTASSLCHGEFSNRAILRLPQDLWQPIRNLARLINSRQERNHSSGSHSKTSSVCKLSVKLALFERFALLVMRFCNDSNFIDRKKGNFTHWFLTQIAPFFSPIYS